MFGNIKYISDNEAHVENAAGVNMSGDLMNVHVVFEEENQAILGEVTEVNDTIIKIRFLGEFDNGRYVSGVIRKPKLSSKIRIINDEELNELMGSDGPNSFLLGASSIYNQHQVYVNINQFFANHAAIFGNTGSGKSCGVARLVQNIFSNPNLVPYNANLFIFDAYGEYKTAFRSINQFNSCFSYKFISSNPTDPEDTLLQIPVHLLNLDDWSLFLQASNHSQIPIIERTLKLAKIFAQNDENAMKYKNHLIAKALLAILFSNQTTAHKKNEIFTIIEACSTPEFSFDSVIQGLGYTRVFSECFEIDSNGNFGESVLITEYILKHIDESLEGTAEPENSYYTLIDFAKAMEFTLISEGFQSNQQVYDDAMLLKVRLNSVINSKLGTFFQYDKPISMENYISSLVAVGNNKKAQIININLEDVDDTYAKVIVKIIARFCFEFAKGRKQRASIPFNLFVEEAHRYIQKDTDTFLIGYNIFDRIAKEGRKYGVLLDIITQRPVELSDTVIAQCSNFLIFKMTHPLDIDYISKMLPNISTDILDKQKVLQPGNCVGFGSAFKINMIIKMEMPNPSPYSNSCDVSARWRVSQQTTTVNVAPEIQMPPQENTSSDNHTGIEPPAMPAVPN